MDGGGGTSESPASLRGLYKTALSISRKGVKKWTVENRGGGRGQGGTSESLYIKVIADVLWICCDGFSFRLVLF